MFFAGLDSVQHLTCVRVHSNKAIRVTLALNECS